MASLYVLMFNGASIKDFILFDSLKEAISALNDAHNNSINEKEYWIEVFEKKENGAYMSTDNYIKREFI